MSSETYGIFGPGGLLAKMEAEEESGSRELQSMKKDPKSTVDDNKSTSVERQAVQQNEDVIDLQDLNINQPAGDLQNPVIALSDLPPMEAALSIEKISKAIFSLLDPSDLLRCRLVSSSWLLMATNDELLKWNKRAIRIHLDLQQKCSTAAIRKVRTMRPLKDLTDVLDGLGSHMFPSSASIIIKNLTFAPSVFLGFLDCYGFLVNSLDVEFQEFLFYSIDSMLNFVTRLLTETEQVPNLTALKLKFQGFAKCEGKMDLQLLETIRKGSYCAPKRNQNLRIIEFGERTPHEIIEAVCCLAPKVESLVAMDFRFWMKNLHLLHLLKTLEFEPLSNKLEEMVTIETVFDSVQEIGLKKLYAHFLCVQSIPQMWPSLTFLLTRILEKSRHSLEELILFPLCFLPGMVLPQMPKLKTLSLTLPSLYPDELSLFPQGISIANTFPTLNTIRFCRTWTSFSSLCKDEKVTSVKKITIDDISSAAKAEVENYFPNAKVTVVNYMHTLYTYDDE